MPLTMNEAAWAGLERAIVAHRRAIMEGLTGFLRLDTVSQNPAGVRAGGEWLVQAMKARGLDADLMETGGNPAVYGSLPLPGARRTVLVYCHFDVKPAPPRRVASALALRAGASPRNSRGGRADPRPGRRARRPPASAPPLRAGRFRRQGPHLGPSHGAGAHAGPGHRPPGGAQVHLRRRGRNGQHPLRPLHRAPPRPPGGRCRAGDGRPEGRERTPHGGLRRARDPARSS